MVGGCNITTEVTTQLVAVILQSLKTVCHSHFSMLVKKWMVNLCKSLDALHIRKQHRLRIVQNNKNNWHVPKVNDSKLFVTKWAKRNSLCISYEKSINRRKFILFEYRGLYNIIPETRPICFFRAKLGPVYHFLKSF